MRAVDRLRGFPGEGCKPQAAYLRSVLQLGARFARRAVLEIAAYWGSTTGVAKNQTAAETGSVAGCITATGSTLPDRYRPANRANSPPTPETRARKHSSSPAPEQLPRRHSDFASGACPYPLLATPAGRHFGTPGSRYRPTSNLPAACSIRLRQTR